MSDKINFQCPYCRTQLAVPAEYAGQQAKCPGCNAVVSVPDDDLSETAPYTSPLNANPLPSQSMGYAREVEDKNGSRQAYNSTGQYDTRSLHDANQTGPNQFGGQGQVASTAAPQSSFGRSFLGLLAAVFVGFVCAIAWLAVILIFQVEIGILAWGIGALIGLVAGSIAKNPSGLYCFLVACVAGFSILSSKILMVGFLMVASIGVNFVDDLQNLVLSNKFEHAYVDQQLADNQLPPEEVTLATAFNSGYFEQSNGPNVVINGREIGGVNGNLDPMDSKISQFRKKVREAVANATKDEKASWIENARKRHPDWIVDASHAIAAKILFVNEAGKLDEDLKLQAEYEIRSSDYLLQVGDQSDSYLTKTSEETLALRSDTLKTLVLAKLRDLDSKALEELTKEAVAKDPTFVADEVDFVVILDELLAKGEIPLTLRAHATGRVKTVTDSAFSATFYTDLGTEAFVNREMELRKIVNPIWLASNQDQMDDRLTSAKARHPKWDPDSQNPQWISSDDFKEEIGDGSFIGSVQKVFSISDVLWLFLGFISAFGTARSRADRSN